MTETLEQRVASLEQRLAELEKDRFLAPPVKKDPWSTFGWAKDAKHFDAATAAGEEWRKSQTYEKEIEARGGVGY